jgi:hypothetical protein
LNGFAVQFGVNGIPVGCSQPIFQDIKMQRNKTMEIPTLKASARIMRLDLGAPSASPRIMKKNAVDKAASMPRNAAAINMFITLIIQ